MQKISISKLVLCFKRIVQKFDQSLLCSYFCPIRRSRYLEMQCIREVRFKIQSATNFACVCVWAHTSMHVYAEMILSNTVIAALPREVEFTCLVFCRAN